MQKSVVLGTITKSFYRTFALLIAADILVIFAQFYLHHDNMHGFIPLFDFERERSIPVLFTTTLFIFAALQCLFLASLRLDKQAYKWKFIAIIFIYCGIDEFCSIHERFSFPMQQWLHTSGIFYYGWILPYGLIVLLLGMFFLSFLFTLPMRTRLSLINAAAIFVSGAIGFEMLGGAWFDQNAGQKDLLYNVFVLCEESLEMLGILVFISGIKKYMHANKCSLTVES